MPLDGNELNQRTLQTVDETWAAGHRQSSETGTPASPFFSMANICASLNLLFFVQILLSLSTAENSSFQHYFFKGGLPYVLNLPENYLKNFPKFF